jgi:hypothetical protein
MMWKDIEPFFGLALTSLWLVYADKSLKCHAKAKNKEETQGRMKGVAVSVGVLVAISFVLIAMNVPAALQRTHPDVMAAKATNREICQSAMEKFDYATAEAAIRNSTLEKRLHKEYRSAGRRSIGYTLEPFLNRMFIGVGVCLSVLPIFIMLALQMIGNQVPAIGRILLKLPFPSEADFSLVLLPALNMITVYAWVTVVAFHFWLREKQVDDCCLLSGHWYTFSHATAAAALTCVFFYTEAEAIRPWHPWYNERKCTKNNNYAYYYLAYITAFTAITMSTVLKNSQIFHHDAVESHKGLVSFAMVLPLAVIATLIALHRSLASLQSSGFQNILKEGSTCAVIENYTADDGTELVKGVSMCRVTEDQKLQDKMVQVLIAKKTKDGKVVLGDTPVYVPIFCLVLNEDLETAVADPEAADAGVKNWAQGLKKQGVAEVEVVAPPPPPPADDGFAKYRMMKRNNLPEGAIRQKMKMSGISDADADNFFSFFAGETSAGSTSDGAVVDASAAATTPAASSTPSPAGGLLDQIGAGVKLKKATPAKATPAPKAGGGLLAQLNAGVKLKKTKPRKEKPKGLLAHPPSNPLVAALNGFDKGKLKKSAPRPQKVPEAPAGIAGALANAIAARRDRIAIEQDQDDDDDGTDWC